MPVKKKSAKSYNNFFFFSFRENWESVIGLEIHAQLNAQSKLFSSSENMYGAPVNSKVSLFDAAIPGTLPVLNRKCVELAVLSSLALKCKVSPVSYFDRKHYFYSDLPVRNFIYLFFFSVEKILNISNCFFQAGFQITQQRLPIAVDGSVNYMVFAPGKKIKLYKKVAKIKQIQIEQDSGKSMHNEVDRVSFIDLNRANVGLIEIVFEPDINESEEAAALIKEIIVILERAGACTCKMEGKNNCNVSMSVVKNIFNFFRGSSSG